MSRTPFRHHAGGRTTRRRGPTLVVAILLAASLPAWMACDDSGVAEEPVDMRDIIGDAAGDTPADASQDTAVPQDTRDDTLFDGSGDTSTGDSSRDTSDTVDTGVTDTATGDGDATDATDVPDAGTCRYRTLVEVPVQSFTLLETMPAKAQRSFRVAAEVQYSNGCHSRAMPVVEIDDTQREIRVTVRAWLDHGVDCTEGLVPDSRYLTLYTTVDGEWTVRDASMNGTETLAVTIEPPTRDPCTPGTSACNKDCDCAEGVCLSGLGLAGPFYECARPCEENFDCAAGELCTTFDDGLDRICSSADVCGSDGCPSGYSCGTADSCSPDFQLGASSRAVCRCDGDCGAPLRCVYASPAATTGRCEIACPTESGRWCSGPHTCGPAQDDLSGLAKEDSVCVFLGE